MYHFAPLEIVAVEVELVIVVVVDLDSLQMHSKRILRLALSPWGDLVAADADCVVNSPTADWYWICCPSGPLTPLLLG